MNSFNYKSSLIISEHYDTELSSLCSVNQVYVIELCNQGCPVQWTYPESKSVKSSE